MPRRKKRTRKVVMTVVCLLEDSKDVKASLFSKEGECWFYGHNCPLANIKVKVVTPTPEEEREACDVLDVEP